VTKYCYLLTEGAQDITFLIKLLKYQGIKQIEKRSKVDPFWEKLIPNTFPHNDELNRQVPVPKFLEGDGLSIALQGAVGDTRLVNTIQDRSKCKRAANGILPSTSYSTAKSLPVPANSLRGYVKFVRSGDSPDGEAAPTT
jgi:hypothetical protein